MIRITTRRDVAPQIDGYAADDRFDALCNEVWLALGKTLGEARRIAPSGSVSHYVVERDALEQFCDNYLSKMTISPYVVRIVLSTDELGGDTTIHAPSPKAALEAGIEWAKQGEYESGDLVTVIVTAPTEGFSFGETLAEGKFRAN